MSPAGLQRGYSRASVLANTVRSPRTSAKAWMVVVLSSASLHKGSAREYPFRRMFIFALVERLTRSHLFFVAWLVGYYPLAQDREATTL